MMLGKGCVFIFQKLMAAIPGAGMDAEFYEREEGRRGRGVVFSSFESLWRPGSVLHPSVKFF